MMAPEAPLSEVIRLFFQLLDLSRDLERNKDDAAFRSNRGTISYVFDATVMEIFVNPRDHRGRAASLHVPTWSLGDLPQNWAACAAQTALSTAEYLLDLELPGQKSGRIFMTEWHRWELKRRVDQLQFEQVALLREADADSYLKRFAPVQEALAEFDSKAGKVEEKLDPELAKDVAELRDWKAKPGELRAYVGTRLALGVLAEDELLEPAEQLRRLVTSPLRQAFNTLHLHFRPDDAARRTIAAEARRWRDRIVEECERNGIPIAIPGQRLSAREEAKTPRSEPAIWDDARSLALVLWAAGKVQEGGDKERLVFVTADRILFDTYRRWYAELPPDDPAYGDPFALRRIGQYAPVLNLIDSGKVKGDQYLDLFQEMQQVLELMLLPLNLSHLASKAPAVVLSRMREMTALRLTEPRSIESDPAYAPLIEAIKQEGVAEMADHLGVLIDRWREFERAALGQADAQVQRRVQSFERQFVGLDHAASKEAFGNYVHALVQSLLTGSREMSLPLARDFIDQWQPPERKLSRAPIALRLVVDVGGRELAIGEMLEARVHGRAPGPLADEAGWQALFKEPALVFAIAAAQCVTSGDWSNALNFSEMALLADRERTEGSSDEGGDQSAEIKYLAALVKRFRMGEIGAPLSVDALFRMERNYHAALPLLDECVDYHGLLSSPRQTLRAVRALSERAALHLFYSSALNPLVREAALERRLGKGVAARRPLDDGASQRGRSVREDEGLTALDAAERDLRACLDWDRSLDEEEIEPKRQEFRLRLQRQYFTNIAAAAVLRALWEGAPPSSERLLAPQSDEAIRRVRKVLERYGEDAHPLMRAECNAFLSLAGDARARRALEEGSAQKGGQMLNLDAALILAIRQHIPFASVVTPAG